MESGEGLEEVGTAGRAKEEGGGFYSLCAVFEVSFKGALDKMSSRTVSPFDPTRVHVAPPPGSAVTCGIFQKAFLSPFVPFR